MGNLRSREDKGVVHSSQSSSAKDEEMAVESELSLLGCVSIITRRLKGDLGVTTTRTVGVGGSGDSNVGKDCCC